MKLSHPSRFVAVFVALFSMLFMQLALASYACPGVSIGNGDDMAAMAAGVAAPVMADCEGMDQSQPALCHAHAQDQQSKQSLDKPQSPDVPPFIAVGLVLASYSIHIAARPLPPQPDSAFLAHSSAPPLSIRHCCFRI